MNIGIVLFGVVFIYLAVTLIIYASDKKIAVYEVREGSILNDSFCTGIAVRDEKVILSEAGGYINYLQSEYSMMNVGLEAYAVTAQPLLHKERFAAADEGLSAEKRRKAAALIQNFNENYSPDEFSSVYALKNEISNLFSGNCGHTKTSRIDDALKESGMSAERFSAPEDGIMLQYVDGYEDLDFNSVKASDFDKEGYDAGAIRDNDPIKKGEPAYKLVTGNKWQVIVKIDEKTAEKLIGADEVNTRINKEREILRAGISLSEKDGEFYAILKYNDSMIRWAGERFLGVDIIIEDVKGLKIPKSALIRQDFYVIPKKYIKKEKDGSKIGVDLQEEDGKIKFTPVRIYKTTSEGMAFIGKKNIPSGCVIINRDSGERQKIAETKALDGVFNLNKGYAGFKQVDILCESGDYCIVSAGDVYGLHNYDHIAQDSGSVREDEAVF